MAPVATSHGGRLPGAPGRGVRRLPARPASTGWCARRSTWARGRSCWSAATPTRPRRFGVDGGRRGLHPHRPAVLRPTELTERVLARLRAAVDAAGLWDELDTDWLLLDAELLPWSAKAVGLLREQYAAVGAAARAALPAALAALRRAAAAAASTWPSCSARHAGAARRTRRRSPTAYRRYCWPTDGLDGVRLAPFQVLAAEGAHARRAATTTGTSRWPTGWSRPTRRCSRRPGRLVVDPADAGRGGRRRPTGGWS